MGDAQGSGGAGVAPPSVHTPAPPRDPARPAGPRRRPRWVAAVAAAVLAVVLGALTACSGAGGAGAAAPASGSPAPGDVSADGALPGPWDPEHVRMPADVAEPATSPCALVPRPDGWLRRENAQPGAVGFAPPADVRPAAQVVGYADRTSAACGDVVSVALAGPLSQVRLEAYRVGAYQQARARLVWSSGEIAVGPRARPARQRGTNLIEPRWPVSVRFAVTSAWPPGFYLLVPDAVSGPAGPAIPLVVRDDVGREPVFFVASTMTWNAYDEWGGYSLYHGPGRTAAARFAARATVASFRRPLVGAGYRQLVLMDLPVVEQVEACGLDAAYTTDVDLDQYPSRLLHHDEIVLGGHSEYWTRRAYDALVVARNAGVNLAFLGANNLWWHARLEQSPGSPLPDRQVVHRVRAGDPALPSRPGDLTLLWSQWPEHRDGAAVLGQSHAAIAVHGGYQLLGVPAWMLAGTGLHAGTPQAPGSVLPLAVGNEADGYNPAAANPAGLDVLAVGVLQGVRGPVLASASYYVASSWAGVFAAGSTDWSCGLRGPCGDQIVPSATSAALRAWTRNVLWAFRERRAGATHPAVPGLPPPPAVLLGRLDPAAVGTYGGSEDSEESGKSRSARSVARLAPGIVRVGT